MCNAPETLLFYVENSEDRLSGDLFSDIDMRRQLMRWITLLNSAYQNGMARLRLFPDSFIFPALNIFIALTLLSFVLME